MKRYLLALFATTLFAGMPVVAQFVLPEIPFDSAPDFIKTPDDLSIYLGEVAGVATNSKGDIFVYTRTGHPTVSLGGSRAFAHGGSRLFQFDKAGKFVKEIGQDSYGMMVAQAVRVDPQDNIWTVDSMTNMVIKWAPDGSTHEMLLGRKAEDMRIPTPPLNPPPPPPGAAGPGGQGARPAGGPGGPAAAAGGEGPAPVRGLPGAGAQQDVFVRPADVAWDSAGNIYVADGLGNARIAKFDKNGKFVRSWGSKGTDPGLFGNVHSLAIDAQNNIYAADSANRRIQVFDSDGNLKTTFLNVGSPMAICITSGPHQFIYSSDSNPANDIDKMGEIYKLELNGKLVGKFGRAGKQLKEFGTVNSIDCRSENDLLVGEIGNWRVQKLTLHPSAEKK
jgi:DNA-binding beta-propeller fold protein YncE